MLDDASATRVPRTSRVLPSLRVAAVAGARSRGKIIIGTSVYACVLGPTGVVSRKREGDGGTPRGRYRLRRLLFRADRSPRPLTRLPSSAVGRHDGWCDDVRSIRYNQQVYLPFSGRHEQLWRSDRLYDLLVVIGHNTEPIRKGLGSAIFLHVEALARTPTAGCVAVAPAVLRRLLGRVGPRTTILIS